METNWQLQPLFDESTSLKYRASIQQQVDQFNKKWRQNSAYLKDPKVTQQALAEYDHFRREFGSEGNEGFYFWLKSQLDQNDPALRAKSNNAQDFVIKITNELQFFELSLSKISPNTQRLFLNSPILKNYRHFLETLFVQSKFLLSEPEEKIITLKNPAAHQYWTKMTAGFLAKETRIILGEDNKKSHKNFSEILSLLSSPKKPVRDSAALAFNDILDKYKDVAEAEMNAILDNKKVDDHLRGFHRPEEARIIYDDISLKIVDSLITAVASSNTIARRFYKLKANVLKVRKLSYHERNVEVGSTNKKYNFDQALELVGQVFYNLDPQFKQILDSFLASNLIDVYPKLGKRSGAFCAYNALTQPTFILLNHTNTLNDVLTLAHEMGHGINDELIRKTQSALYFGTPLSTAEVASTFMEDFVLEEILSSADDELKFNLLMMKLNSDISTIFRQVACFKFEQELHRRFRAQGYLSFTEIGRIFQKHMKSYMGPAVEQSPGSQNWWIYWNHIRSFFYVYSYASGLLISKAMQNGVKKDPNFIVKVKQFLAAGLSDSPVNIFRKMEIDITKKDFWQTGLLEVDNLLTQTETLAQKLHKF